MMIPIVSQTTQELRELARMIRVEPAPPMSAHSYILQLIDEIARLRDLEVVVCRTTWHDHEPEEPGVQLELVELTQLMVGPGELARDDQQCSQALMRLALPAPRYCTRCGLGPCVHGSITGDSFVQKVASEQRSGSVPGGDNG